MRDRNLAAPELRRLVGVEERPERGVLPEHLVVHQGGVDALDMRVIVRSNGRAPRIRLVDGPSQPRFGRSRPLVVEAELQRSLAACGGRKDELPEGVVRGEAVIVETVALLVERLDDVPASVEAVAVAPDRLEEAVVAGVRFHGCRWVRGRPEGEEIDDAAHGLRAEENAAASLAGCARSSSSAVTNVREPDTSSRAWARSPRTRTSTAHGVWPPYRAHLAPGSRHGPVSHDVTPV